MDLWLCRGLCSTCVRECVQPGSRLPSDAAKHERLLDLTNSRVVPKFIDDVVTRGSGSNSNSNNAQHDADEVGVELWEAACGITHKPLQSPVMLSLALPRLRPVRAKSPPQHQPHDDGIYDDDSSVDPQLLEIVHNTQVTVARVRPQSAKSTRSDVADSARGGAWSIRPSSAQRRSTIASSATTQRSSSPNTLHASASSLQLSFKVRCSLV